MTTNVVLLCLSVRNDGQDCLWTPWTCHYTGKKKINDVISTSGLCRLDSVETKDNWYVGSYRANKNDWKTAGTMFILGCVLCNSKLRDSFDNIFLSFSMKVARGNAEGNQGSQSLMETLGKKGSLATRSWKSNSKKAQCLSIIIFFSVVLPASLLSSVWFLAEDVERQCGFSINVPFIANE